MEVFRKSAADLLDFLKHLKIIYIGTDEYSVKSKLTNIDSLVL